jgi:hypothetical protein
MLVGLLIPALAMVRNMAKETQQKAQLTTIEMGLTAFKNDYGDYPPSDWTIPPGDYCGAQKLTEALVGWDLMGFHPKSAWRADGEDKDGGNEAYLGAVTGSQQDRERNLKERRGPYLELATTNAFKLEQLFDDTTPLASDTFVLCDVFGSKTVTLADGKNVKAGSPILYYKANASSKTIENVPVNERIYNVRDNVPLTTILKSISDGKEHPLGKAAGTYQAFYDYITDLKVTAIKWPYRPDSYILISAGVDGLYGTSDDIRNF